MAASGDTYLDEETDELYERHHIIADKGQAPVRIDKFLAARISGVSRNRIQDAASVGYIVVNGKPVKSNYKVKSCDDISVMMNTPPQENVLIPENIPLNIVYEDDDVLVVNKPAGLVVHPGVGNFTGTLVNALLWYYKDNPCFPPDDLRPGLVHRIDKNTSGLLLIAKNQEAKTNLGWQFFNKTTDREYVALVWGEPENEKGTIVGNVGRNPKDRMAMTVFPEGSEEGKHAVTHYEILEKFGYVTSVKCKLETGRTHQIRAHMKYIGHPLFNDEKYGGNEILRGTRFSKYTQFVKNCFNVCPRHALHAKTLGFTHPRTGKRLFFESELPDDMKQLFEKWRRYISSRDNI